MAHFLQINISSSFFFLFFRPICYYSFTAWLKTFQPHKSIADSNTECLHTYIENVSLWGARSADTCGIFMCLIGVGFLQNQICVRLWLVNLIYSDLYVGHSFSAVPAHNSSISLGTLEFITLNVPPLATFVCRAVKWGWQQLLQHRSCNFMTLVLSWVLICLKSSRLNRREVLPAIVHLPVRLWHNGVLIITLCEVEISNLHNKLWSLHCVSEQKRFTLLLLWPAIGGFAQSEQQHEEKQSQNSFLNV